MQEGKTLGSKEVSKLDRDIVWSKKALLDKSGMLIYIRKHFDDAIKKNIRKLVPIRREN